MSYLSNNKFARIIDFALKDIEVELQKVKPTSPSKNIQDYMHLSNFKENINTLQRVSEVGHYVPSNIFTFTRQTQIDILKALLAGATIKLALDLAKVKEKTFKYWESMADRDIEPFATFIAECRMAQAGLDMELIQRMRSGGWKGAVELWKLRHPESNPDTSQGRPGAVINQTVNILDKRPEERWEIINSQDIAPPNPGTVINYDRIVDVDEN